MSDNKIEVVVVYSPRPSHEKFVDFVPMLHLQRQTVEKFGHKHVVVCDQPLPGFNVMLMPELADASLMHAILQGQLAYLEQWSGKHPVVLVDADCLIARPLRHAFQGQKFDLLLTSREGNSTAPINNGAMYVNNNGNKDGVVRFFRAALDACHRNWGGDQEAIAKAAAPVPNYYGSLELRHGARVFFASMRTYNCVPRVCGERHANANPFVVHFKGVERKPWMETYARLFILGGL